MSRRITAAVLTAVIAVLGVASTTAPADARPAPTRPDTGWD